MSVCVWLTSLFLAVALRPFPVEKLAVLEPMRAHDMCAPARVRVPHWSFSVLRSQPDSPAARCAALDTDAPTGGVQ